MNPRKTACKARLLQATKEHIALRAPDCSQPASGRGGDEVTFPEDLLCVRYTAYMSAYTFDCKMSKRSQN